MALRFAYLAVLRVFGWLALLARSDQAVLLAGLDVGDEQVQTAMRRLERVVGEYRTWVKVTAG